MILLCSRSRTLSFIQKEGRQSRFFLETRIADATVRYCCTMRTPDRRLHDLFSQSARFGAHEISRGGREGGVCFFTCCGLSVRLQIVFVRKARLTWDTPALKSQIKQPNKAKRKQARLKGTMGSIYELKVVVALNKSLITLNLRTSSWFLVRMLVFWCACCLRQ